MLLKFFKLDWLLPTEKLVLLMCMLAGIFFFAFDLPFHDPWHYYLIWLRPVPLGYFLALFVCFLIFLFQDGVKARWSGEKPNEGLTWRRFVEAYLSPAGIFRDLRYINAINIMFLAFLHLKHVIPHVNSKRYDAFIWNLEKTISWGRSPTEWMQQLFGNHTAEYWSYGYEAFYGYFCIIVFIFILQRNRVLAEEFCSAFVAIWLFGILMVYALPTWGPCFYFPDTVKGLPETAVSVMQSGLWKWKLALDLDPKNSEALFSISGLPSLHFGVTVLGSIYLAKLNKFLAALSWLFVAITFCTTLYFGWHYLSDNLAALFLVWISILYARAILPKSAIS